MSSKSLSPDQQGETAAALCAPAGASRAVDLATGKRLKALREICGLSQRELAKRAAMTNSNVSMIEQGSVSPSIQSLERLLNVFPISLADFFTWDFTRSSPQTVSHTELVANQRVTTTGSIQQDWSSVISQPQIELTRIQLAAGQQTAVFLANGRDYSGYIISGVVGLLNHAPSSEASALNSSLNATFVGTFLELSAGEGFYIRSGQLYCLRNASTGDASVLLSSLRLLQP